MGLILSRKKGQRIIINGNIILEVTEINRNNVSLDFVFPETASVLREEIIERAKESGNEGELYLRGLTG